MHSNTQVFSDFSTTLRTLLRGSPSIDFGEKLAPFPAHILSKGTKLTESRIEHVLAKHTFSTNLIVQVFGTVDGEIAFPTSVSKPCMPFSWHTATEIHTSCHEYQLPFNCLWF